MVRVIVRRGLGTEGAGEPGEAGRLACRRAMFAQACVGPAAGAGGHTRDGPDQVALGELSLLV